MEGLQGQHLHCKISGMSAYSLQLQQGTSPRLRVPKSVFARVSRRGALALHQERKTDQHGVSRHFCRDCCRIRKASLSSLLKLQAAGLSKTQTRACAGVSALLKFAHLFHPSSAMEQWSLTGDLSRDWGHPANVWIRDPSPLLPAPLS